MSLPPDASLKVPANKPALANTATNHDQNLRFGTMTLVIVVTDLATKNLICQGIDRGMHLCFSKIHDNVALYLARLNC